MTDSHSSPEIPMAKVIANELEIIGSHGIQAYKYAEIIKLISENNVEVSKMISETISLEQVPEALPMMPQSLQPGISVINKF